MLRKALLAAAASERIRQAAMSAPGAQAIVGRYVAGESSEGAVCGCDTIAVFAIASATRGRKAAKGLVTTSARDAKR